MVTIIGNGGHGKMLAALLRGITLAPVKLLTAGEEVTPDQPVVIGIGNVVQIGNSGLKPRRQLYEKYISQVTSVLHPSIVFVNSFLYNTHGLQAMPLAVVNANAIIGKNVILNTGCIVEHDCFVGSHSHIAPRATLCGKVRVGEETHVGAGSVIRQGTTIGSRCVIAMGSVVTKDVPDGKTWLKGEII